MRNLCWFASGVVVLSTAFFWEGASNSNAAGADLDAANLQFVGHYELLSFISYPEQGGQVDNNYEGRITYDAHGNMTAIGMPKDLPIRAAASSENVHGGFSYYGDVSWDVDNQVVIHHVTGSTSRGSWVGEDNIRYYEWVDGLLVLAMKDPDGRIIGKLTWRKFE